MNTDPIDFNIIVIDDNPAIHHDFIKILTTTESHEALDQLSSQLFGKKDETLTLPQFAITTASQGQEGVELIQKGLQAKKPFALAFVDIRMPPGWDGVETIKHIWELDKDIQVVICTAYSDYSWEETIAHLGKTDNLLILKKPFDHIAVRQLACALTKKWQLLQEAYQYTSSLKQQVEDRTLSLQKSLSLVKATLESSNDGILVISDEGHLIDYNQKLVDMWQIPSSILNTKEEGKILEHMKHQLVSPDDFIKNIKKIHAATGALDIDIIKFKDGRTFECFSQPQKMNDEIAIGRVLNFHDITKRANLERDLELQATHDALTGLPNRIKLIDRLHEAINHAEKNHSAFAVMFLDLDRFKLVNDSLSHAAGDELLQAAAGRLQSIMRTEDTLARLGGDEFVIIMTNLSNQSQAVNKGNELLQIFKQPFKIAGREVSVTSSIGISFYPAHGTSIDNLLRNADSAMYRAKELGSNNFQFYTEEMNAHSLDRLETETQLRQAVERNEFFLCYQPQFDLALNKVVAVEALVRWQHPTRGLLLPIDFIPLAEKTGLITAIGEWALRTACRENKKWQEEGLPHIRVAVNVTMQQFNQQDLVKLISDVLQETGLAPKYLEIELTENVIISSMEIMNTVAKIKELGVFVAIDDFGTGYSSLSYLKKIPLDRLKIDSSFIQNIKSKADDDVIIRAVIAMAKSLNLEVLAEGVETQNQINFLQKNDCGEIQGFYFSKPLTSENLKKILQNPKEAKLIKEP